MFTMGSGAGCSRVSKCRSSACVYVADTSNEGAGVKVPLGFVRLETGPNTAGHLQHIHLSVVSPGHLIYSKTDFVVLLCGSDLRKPLGLASPVVDAKHAGLQQDMQLSLSCTAGLVAG